MWLKTALEREKDKYILWEKYMINDIMKFWNDITVMGFMFVIPSVRISITMSLRPCTCLSVCVSVRLPVRPLVIREDAKVAIGSGKKLLLHIVSINDKFYRLGLFYISLYLHRGVSLGVISYVSLVAVRENHQKSPKKTIWTRKNHCTVLY